MSTMYEKYLTWKKYSVQELFLKRQKENNQ